jgi:hypothetical protein
MGHEIKQTARRKRNNKKKNVINFTVIQKLYKKCFPKQIDSSLLEDIVGIIL